MTISFFLSPKMFGFGSNSAWLFMYGCAIFEMECDLGLSVWSNEDSNSRRVELGLFVFSRRVQLSKVIMMMVCYYKVVIGCRKSRVIIREYVVCCRSL